MLKILNLLKSQKRLIFILLGAFFLQLFAGCIILFIVFIQQIQLQLDQKIQRIKTDVQFKNDLWDLSLYNSDPRLIGTYPLYFITIDGFVLDRRAPIHGFLDTSDFKRLLILKSPQTVQSITGQSRRIYSKPIMYQNKPIAVIAVSYFNPSEEQLSQIDEKLLNAANDIYTKISFDKGIINTSKLDLRKIPYDISFTIVDSYNTILTKTANVNNINRIPNFIDPSYIKKQTTTAEKRIIRDTQTNELFLIQSSPIQKNSNTVAIIAVGQSIDPLLTVLKQYLVLEEAISLIIIFFTTYIFVLTKNRKKENTEKKLAPKQIIFNEKRGMLVIDGEDIEIPYATNQFYLLQMLFSNPSKRWETDELLERFGEHLSADSSRKVYDAMISINKKVAKISPIKLILNQNKTYQLNPQVLATK